ncbi:MAG: lamin tail domain-containing protein [Flavobacteriales bacterium]|nr:lamin tail domain-containing protein [Flavobacteriales bacterium]
MKFKYVLAACCAAVFFSPANGQLYINEVQVSNLTSFADQDGDYEDWFEIFNSGTSTVNLAGYTLSDNNNNLAKWTLPNRNLAPGEHVVVWASGKDMGGGNSHYENAFQASTFWKFKVPTSEPPSDWRTITFNATTWSGGAGGIGYGDGDDATQSGSCFSVFMRKTFSLTNIAAVKQIVLHMDFDDGFVAYLNGVEIARQNVGTVGVNPTYNTAASSPHEALGLTGLANINKYIIPEEIWLPLLVNGTNVLAVQTHNYSYFDGDLTSKPYLSFLFDSPTTQFAAPPAWMALIPQLHSNFKLDTGEKIYLSDPLGNMVDEVEIEPTELGDSFARMVSGSPTWCFAENPTPGANNSNTTCASEYEPKPIFSLEGGKYSTAQSLVLSTTSPTAQIRYTLNGNLPTETSPLYTSPLSITGSTTVSARCFSTSSNLDSPVEKNTYMINESNLSLPVIAISTDSLNLYDYNTGIYVFGPEDYQTWVPYWGANFWEDWERDAYIEYYDLAGVKQFEGGAGIQIHGGWSRVNAQKSFRILMRDDYGFDEINYPLMHDKNFIDTWKSFNLRNGGNDYWGPRFHDALMQRVMKGTYVDYMGYTPVLSFLNGEYFGMYELREHENENYCANNLGVDPDDATVISYSYQGFKVINGNSDSFFDMYNYIMNTAPANAGFYPGVDALLDIQNYADYIIAETYWCNGDWSNGWINNTKFWHDDNPGGRWRFMLMDLDFGMGLAGNSPTDDYINTAGDEGYYTDQMFSRLIQNTTFKNYFINRYADLINTTFQQTRVEDMAYEMQSEIEDAYSRHCSHWGTDCGSIDWLVDQRLDWNAARVQGARDVVESHFSLPGQVDLTLTVQPAGAGYIKISTIVPENLPWTGVYFNGVPVTVTAYPNPGYTFDHWATNTFISNTALPSFTNTFTSNSTFTAHFSGSAATSDLIVSELNYNPDASRPDGDWIELHNPNSAAVDLSAWELQDQNPYNRFVFPSTTVIPAGGYLVIAEDPTAFALEHPGISNVIGPLGFDLNNGGEELSLYDVAGNPAWVFAYNDHASWPQTPDGHGRTLERKFPLADANLGSSWFDGCMGGSPGAAFTPCNDPLIITEINYRSAPAQNAGDWIEIYNASIGIIDFTNWKIEDANGNFYQFNSPISLNNGAYHVLAQNDSLFTSQFPDVYNVSSSFAFGFSGDGDVIRLSDATGRLAFSLAYNDVLPWPLEPDGGGFTAELNDYTGNFNDGANWFTGCPEGSPGAAFDPGCSTCIVFGCNDPAACNFLSLTACDDGSCTYPGCTVPSACNYDPDAGCWNNTCVFNVFYADSDNDGYGNPLVFTFTCIAQSGYVANSDDCNDENALMYPGAPATGQGIDNDCSGTIDPDEALPCVGDFNFDGVINISDMLLFMGNYGCAGTCFGDLDNNGTVNTNDLLIFMGLYGGGC